MDMESVNGVVTWIGRRICEVELRLERCQMLFHNVRFVCV